MSAESSALAWASDDLGTVLDACWSLVEAGCRNAGHPLHTPTFGTVAGHLPSLRTVVLRRVERADRMLEFHTHSASEKVPQLRAQSGCVWHFYDPGEKVQLRAVGRAQLHHHDDVAAASWKTVPLTSRRCYCTIIDPGKECLPEDGPVSGLPPELTGRQPTEEESQRLGWPHYMVVQTRLERLEFLFLSAGGHRRAVWTWGVDQGAVVSRWLVP